MALKDNLKNLNLILGALREDHLSKADFAKAIREIIDFLKKNHGQNREELREALKSFDEKSNTIKDEIRQSLEGEKGRLSNSEKAHFKKIESQFNALETLVKDRLGDLKDGESPEVDDIVEALKQHIPEPINGSPDSAEEIANKLETLKGSKRLHASAIWGLEKFIKRGFDGLKGSATVPSPQNWAKHESFSMDGVLTKVVLADGVGGGGNALIVRYMGQTLDMTTHYTVDGNTVNFTFTPDNNTTISITFWN